MNLIFTQKQAREKIEGLEARISELEADALSKDEGFEAIQQENISLAEKLTIANQQIEALKSETSKIEPLQQELEETKEQVKEVEKSANLKAVEMAAEAGHDKPIDADITSDSITEKTVSREAFNSKSPAEQMKFIKSGGKITD